MIVNPRRSARARQRRRTFAAALAGAAGALAVAAGAVALALAAGCANLGSLPETLMPPAPREQYRRSLADAGLAETALGRAWLAAGERALAEAAPVELPFREVVFFDPAEPRAAGYRLVLRRGQRLRLTVEPPPGSPGEPPARTFVELLTAAEAAEAAAKGEAPDPVASAEEDGRERDRAPAREIVLQYEPGEDGEWLVRVQPELLAGGRFTVVLDAEPSLGFPVSGHDSRAVGGRFGDPRSGGARRHEGVDIFAPRGTEALAVADARVVRVGTNRLGGNVVWLRTAGSGLGLYYAHLERSLVSSGARVRSGEPVGLVGNTGNARGTPPHLHFGVFDNGALDPWPFLHDPGEPAPVTVELGVLGGWSRVLPARARLRRGPGEGFEAVAELVRSTALRPHGAGADWYRVELPDGMAGFVAARLTAPAGEPLRRLDPAPGRLLRRRPRPGSPALGAVAEDERPAVLAEFGGALLVETASGRRGWLGSGSLGGAAPGASAAGVGAAGGAGGG